MTQLIIKLKKYSNFKSFLNMVINKIFNFISFGFVLFSLSSFIINFLKTLDNPLLLMTICGIIIFHFIMNCLIWHMLGKIDINILYPCIPNEINYKEINSTFSFYKVWSSIFYVLYSLFSIILLYNDNKILLIVSLTVLTTFSLIFYINTLFEGRPTGMRFQLNYNYFKELINFKIEKEK